MSLSRSVSPPRPARNPLRLPPNNNINNNSNVVSHGRGILGRKNSGSSKSSSTRSIATGLVASVASWQAESRTTLSGDTSFDQLLLSDATIKLSFTPDTLRDPAPVTPSISNESNTSNSPSPKRVKPRLPRPRGPLVAIRDETTEESDVSTADESKAALIEVINSVPPWLATPNDTSEPAAIPRPGSRQVGAAGTRKRNQPSNRVSRSRHSRQILLEAKEGARDLASERQINRDLVDFFATAPPPISTSTNARDGSAPSLPHEESKSVPTLQKLVARVTASSTKADKRLTPSSNASRASKGPVSNGGEAGNLPSHSPTAAFLPTSYDRHSLSTHRSNFDDEPYRRIESGFILPAGLIEPYAPGTALPEERSIRASSRPRTGDRRGSALSILRPSSSYGRSEPVENRDSGTYGDGGSAAGATSSPTSTFQTAPHSPRSSQRSRSASTSSLMSSSTFPSPPHTRSPRTQAVLIPPVAVGSALAVESSAAPVTFQHRHRARESVSSSGSERGKQLEVDTGKASARTTVSSTPPSSTETMQTAGLLSPALLLQLRSSMMSAKTRDDCIVLIDEALRKAAPSSGASLAHVAEHLFDTAERGQR